MKKIFILICLVLSFYAVPAGAITKSQFIQEWTRVDICEAKATGGWSSFSYNYPDGLGIDRANWIQFGGWTGGPSSMWTQIAIGIKFLKYYHISIPDQETCHRY